MRRQRALPRTSNRSVRPNQAQSGNNPPGSNQQGIEAVSLGAARLKIIDVGAESASCLTMATRSSASSNREIYNHLELRRELERRGPLPLPQRHRNGLVRSG